MKTSKLSKLIKYLPAVFLIFVLGAGLLVNAKTAFNSFRNSVSARDFSGLEKDFSDNLFLRRRFIGLNGTFAKITGLKDYYRNKNIYVDSSNYVMGIYPYTTTDYEYEETVALYDFLKKNNINLLYVNKPVKYTDDSYTEEEFALESFANRNSDLFLERIREAGVPAIDLRENLKDDGLNIKDMFYRTDHHWTAPAGFWASKVMSNGLNNYCGYNIDLSIYDEDQYDFTHYENCWVGEQGQMISEAYIGRDDYTLIRPKYDTNYTMNIDGADTDGDFNLFINDYTFSETNVTDMSWHYAYGLYNTVNHNADYGKVLMLTDSYDNVTVPFVSLGVRELDNLQMRDMVDDFDLKEYILEKGYDTVIISYAQFMIGAHDNPVSSNYRMFAFDGN